MIDTLNFVLQVSKRDIEALARSLSEVVETYSETTGYGCFGWLDNYKVIADEVRGANFVGSIAKYGQRSNLINTTAEAVKQAVAKMSETTGLNIGGGFVSRFDVGANIETLQPPAAYFQTLGAKPHYRRIESVKDETLYYATAARVLAFYDKKKEATARRVRVPPELQGVNLLRYELRHVCRLKQVLKLSEPLKVCTIYTPEFYRRIVDEWQKHFETINTLKMSKLDSYIVGEDMTDQQAKEYIYGLVALNAGAAVVDSVINRCQFAPNRRYQKTRLKAFFRRVTKQAARVQSETGGDLIEELTAKVSEIAEAQRQL